MKTQIDILECSNCGTKLKASFVFCPVCRSPLDASCFKKGTAGDLTEDEYVIESTFKQTIQETTWRMLAWVGIACGMLFFVPCLMVLGLLVYDNDENLGWFAIPAMMSMGSIPFWLLALLSMSQIKDDIPWGRAIYLFTKIMTAIVCLSFTVLIFII